MLLQGEQKNAFAPIALFYSYAHEDEPLRKKLEKHFSLMRQQGMIKEWHDRQIVPGTDWAHAVDDHLVTAQIILLLISPDFLASDYCYGVEMQRALERHAEGFAQVIPVLLRPVDWESAPFAFLQCLPRGGKPITQWDNQDEALATVARDIRAVIEQSHAPVTRGASTRHWQLSPPSSIVGGGNRQRMLGRVWTIWITGVLEHSLHERALITLGLRDEASEVLANPWRLAMQEVDCPAEPLPVGTRITEVYDEAGGELLILGEPGSGKTTLLLELARDLLDRALQQETHPIPVVFNLSSWTVKHQSLAEWFVEELNLKYQVPRKPGRSWVQDDQLLLLLDGLDEVPASDRLACVEAINTYRLEHGLLPMVVCSRSADYLALSKQILLHRAVTIQPLTSQQIESYLSSAGEQLVAVRVALQGDPVLQELATTPLMLNVLTLAYQGISVDQQATEGLPRIRQQHIFSAYVERMLQRRSGQTRYSREQTKHWLGWLARQLSVHQQTEFYLERMQPDWLAKGQRRRLYSCVSTGLLGALFTALICGVISGLLGPWSLSLFILLIRGPSSDSDPLYPRIHQIFGGVLPTLANELGYSIGGLMIGLVGGTLLGLVGGLLVGLLRTRAGEIKPVEVVTWSWRTWPWDVIASLVIGFLSVFLVELYGNHIGVSITSFVTHTNACVWILGDPQSLASCTAMPALPSFQEMLLSLLKSLYSYQLITGLIFGGVGGLVSSLLRRKLNTHHPPMSDQNRWESMRIGILVGVVDWLIGLPLAYAIGVLLDAPLGGLLHWSSNEPDKPSGILIGGLIGVLLCWLIGTLTFGLLNGYSSRKLEQRLLVVPNQGIRRSARIGLFAGLLGGLLCILLFAPGLTTPYEWGIEWLFLSLFTGLVFALFVALFIGLCFGGAACIKHICLRLFLWRTGCLPWNYAQFLDYAAERILLRKVGGGYIFVHRLLLDYFASLETIPDLPL